MADPAARKPETTWGAVRALLQAGAGVAFVLEDERALGLVLIVVAVCTAVYETVGWHRWRTRASTTVAADAPAAAGAPLPDDAPPAGRGRAVDGTPGRRTAGRERPRTTLGGRARAAR